MLTKPLLNTLRVISLVMFVVIVAVSAAWPVPRSLATGPVMPPQRTWTPFCDNPDSDAHCDPIEQYIQNAAQRQPLKPVGYTGLSNPASGQYQRGTADDPLAFLSRRPLDQFIIPEGGLFLDPLHEFAHYGIDYANPEDYLNGRATYIYPIGPGYVTARADCVACFIDGYYRGRVDERWPVYNFGFGVIVVVEMPYNANVSLYVMYAHLDRDMVGLGDYVTPDEPIGVVGDTGYAQEIHVHMEIRYGPPGRFWNADFATWETMDRWLATMFVNPAWAVFPEYHPTFVRALDEYAGLNPPAPTLP